MRWFIVWFFIIAAAVVHACDECGCALNPEDLSNTMFMHNHYVGMQSTYGRYLYLPTQQTERIYQVSVYGGLHIMGMQMYVVLPFQFFQNTVSNARQSGLGDLSIGVNRMLFDKLSLKSGLLYRGSAGIGFQFPTGKQSLTEHDAHLDGFTFHIGSGSNSLSLQYAQALSRGRLTFSHAVRWQHYFENADRFNFHDRLQNAIRAEYSYGRTDALSLGAGVTHFYWSGASYKDDPVDNSSLNAWFATVSHVFRLEPFQVELRYSVPLARYTVVETKIASQLSLNVRFKLQANASA